jgi:hypothetical protein
VEDENIDIIALIAERKIKEAIEDGQFDNLSGAHKPLKDDELANLPPDIRLAMRIMQNSGYRDISAKDDSVFINDPWQGAPEERRINRAITSLQLKLDKNKKKTGGAKAKLKTDPLAINSPDSLDSLDSHDNIIDSPYLAKILSKIGGST